MAADIAGDDDVLTDRSRRIIAAHKLLRRSRRQEAGEFLADGAQAVREAIAAHTAGRADVRELFFTSTAGARHTDMVRNALRADITVTEVTERAAGKLSDAITPQGLTARCALPDSDPTALLTGAPQLLAVLVETADPGNAGTIIRLADAAGADAVIMAGNAVDPWGPKAVRASAGSIFHLPVCTHPDPVTLLADIADAGLHRLATSGLDAPEGRHPVELETARAQGLLAGPTAWLMGSEAHGLPGYVINIADELITIPIYGSAESLNLATAAALCLYASAAAQRATGTK